MFKNAEKISKAMDMLIKVTDELEKLERKEQLVAVIHELSVVHQGVLGDLRTYAHNTDYEDN
ncbi:hypothetical protein [Radiobacillus deserti]|uniref:Uncharacterized protein n=1 Tax=Radiobacillus deserti TaxID=2594883 RepID=A0A516KHA9_9BACI|nr:hypothetical protein [Radiobacillus deserti]QDP40788.1 hypothetical protein FN924_11690 [Radiobacillus deserti]